jgi:hypothetical protein
MEKAARQRARLAKRPTLVSEPAPAVPSLDAQPLDDDPVQRQANAIHDVLDLLERAEALGFLARRGQTLRTILRHEPLTAHRLARLERRLRGWITRHRSSLA